MTHFWIVAIIATLSWVFFAFAAVELAALVAGRDAVPRSLERLVPEALEAAGLARILGTIFGVAVAVGTQALSVYLLLGRTGELNVAEVAVLLVEVAAALLWGVFLLRRFVRSERAAG